MDWTTHIILVFASSDTSEPATGGYLTHQLRSSNKFLVLESLHARHTDAANTLTSDVATLYIHDATRDRVLLAISLLTVSNTHLCGSRKAEL
jgi:hypothetical protein